MGKREPKFNPEIPFSAIQGIQMPAQARKTEFGEDFERQQRGLIAS